MTQSNGRIEIRHTYLYYVNISVIQRRDRLDFFKNTVFSCICHQKVSFLFPLKSCGLISSKAPMKSRKKKAGKFKLIFQKKKAPIEYESSSEEKAKRLQKYFGC